MSDVVHSCTWRWLGWSWLGLVVLLVGAGASLACSTPTLPLPPPAALSYGVPDADGYVTISGEAEPDNFVVCFNEDRAAGVIVRANALGNFTCRLFANPGDTIEIWQETGTERGLGVSIMIGAPGPDGGAAADAGM